MTEQNRGEQEFDMGQFIKEHPNGRCSRSLMRAARWLAGNRIDASWTKFEAPDFLGAPAEIVDELDPDDVDHIQIFGDLCKAEKAELERSRAKRAALGARPGFGVESRMVREALEASEAEAEEA